MSKLTKKSLVVTAVLGVIYIASLLRPEYFFYIVGLMTLAVVVLWKFYFEVTLDKSVLLQKSRFLILPIIFNIGAIYLSTIFFQSSAKAIVVVLAALTNYFLWISLRKVHNLSDRAAIFHRNVLIVLSFVSIFLGSATIFRLYMLFNTSVPRYLANTLLVTLVFCLFYFVSSFLTWENSASDDLAKLRPYNIVNSLLGAQIAWVSSLWIVNYPVIAVSEKANLGGSPLPAVLLTIVFYFLWGIIFHKIDKNLTRRVLTEYTLITIVFIVVLLATARWLPIF